MNLSIQILRGKLKTAVNAVTISTPDCQSATKTVGFCSITPRRLRVISPPRRLGSRAPVPIAAITIWDPAAEESDGQWEGETADARELQAYSGSGEEGARLPRRGRHRGGSGATPIARNSARPEPLVRGGGVDGGPRREAKTDGKGEWDGEGDGGRWEGGRGKEGSNMKEGGRERWSEGRMDAAAVEGIEMRKEQGIEEEGRKGCADVRECRERECARNPDPARNSGEVGDGIGMQGGWVGWGCVRTRGGMGTECGGTVRCRMRRGGKAEGWEETREEGQGRGRRGAARQGGWEGGAGGREPDTDTWEAAHPRIRRLCAHLTRSRRRWRWRPQKRNGGEEGEERGGTEAEVDAQAGGNGELGASVGVISVEVPVVPVENSSSHTQASTAQHGVS
ncbi:hypothetical protein B0H11DRAFT_1943403 [Mycena galericulata]|nr:hypothetical protein B0H11DRAFT_1943403 [Mycena galericulata]